MTIHSFSECLARSQSHSDAPWWMDVYRKAFPTLLMATKITEDGWAQRGGIDRVLTLASGKTLTVDEKVREKDWPDFFLEVWSDVHGKKPGWIQKDLACDYIAYAFVPSAACFLFPTLTLQRAWRLNGEEWTSEFGIKKAQNQGWTTVGVPVPRQTLFYAVANAMRVDWNV